MQLQIECNRALSQKQFCLICNHFFEPTEAKVIICNDQGDAFGEACPQCLGKGFNWLSGRFEQLLSHPQKREGIHFPRNRKVPAGV
ncbi:hypothetical protein H6G89_00745 [Oscillatoria sp. FACHB-1407]|uniref:hypothetical protein n=1 Tax=Oscillatoria sp. FACHB-1407 TaxID=2692847 RepID=UPI00168A0E0A|nr:hypothetical protein [Oscillatoria sp. FACHB-1407]MBD2459557.1 hypothetical protein [Oscillatoria sp. FACHB-1407]